MLPNKKIEQLKTIWLCVKYVNWVIEWLNDDSHIILFLSSVESDEILRIFRQKCIKHKSVFLQNQVKTLLIGLFL